MSHLQHDAFPPLFATPPQDGCVRVYQTTLLQESPSPYSDSPAIYLVTPYRFFRPFPSGAEPDAFWVPQRFSSASSREVILVAEQEMSPPSRRRLDDYRGWDRPSAHSREVFFIGRWHPSSHVLLSMYCAAPIPVLEMVGDFRALWPRCRYRENVLSSLQTGTPEVIRVWERRWDPDNWLTAIAREFAEVPTLIPTEPAPRLLSRLPPVTESLPAPRLPNASLPSFILEALVRDAIARRTPCPITLEPLTAPSQVTVTDCYHLFDATALASWCASGENKCPVCRETLRSM